MEEITHSNSLLIHNSTKHDQAYAHRINLGDAVMMPSIKNPKKPIKVNFLPVEGDVLEAVFKALEPKVNSVLSKHGATLKMDLREIVRNHAKV